jgi:hypothetical protein
MAQPSTGVNRQTIDLPDFPDLVVIYLGMRVRASRGLGKLLQTGRQIRAAVARGPDGLLLRENIVFSLVPPHLGMRQYWRDLDALERWTRELAHSSGGRTSCVTPPAPASGTRRTSCGVGWRRSTTTWRSRPA